MNIKLSRILTLSVFILTLSFSISHYVYAAEAPVQLVI